MCPDLAWAVLGTIRCKVAGCTWRLPVSWRHKFTGADKRRPDSEVATLVRDHRRTHGT